MSLLDSLFDGLARLIGLPDDRRDLAPARGAIPLPEASSASEPEPEPQQDPQPTQEPEPQPELAPEPEREPEPQPQPPVAADPERSVAVEPERPAPEHLAAAPSAEQVDAAARELPKAELVAVVDLERGATLAARGPLAEDAAGLLDAAARTLLAEPRLLELDTERRRLDQAVVHSDDAVHVFARFARAPSQVLVVVTRDPAQLGLTLAKVGRLVRAA